MPKVKEIHVLCAHCGFWIPSPIMFGGDQSFDSSLLIGNKVQCAKCGKMTSCNKENMRVRYDDGGFVGEDVT